MWRFWCPFLLLLLLTAALELAMVVMAFDRLGLSRDAACLMLLLGLIGSVLEIPVGTVAAEVAPQRTVLRAEIERLLGLAPSPFSGRTVVAVNVGGAVVPVAFALFLVVAGDLALLPLLAVVAWVSTLSYVFSTPIPRVGIGLPVFVAPLGAALASLLIDPLRCAPLAYVGGTLGVLIGADLLRLKNVSRLGAPVAAIGGAGTFDGIFLTGLIAVLLA